MRHGRHHAALHQAQLAGEGRRTICRACCTRRSSRYDRPPGPGGGRHSQGHSVREGQLLQAQGLPAQRTYKPRSSRDIEDDREGRRADGGMPSVRCSTPAAASSIPARKRATLLRELVKLTGFPITSTLMGLGAFPASDPQWLGMLGMHGTYEANLAMHDCDLMICLGARFDDRVTGRVDAFSPGSKKIHLDIDPSLDQQECPRRCADHRRLCAWCSKTWCGSGAPARRKVDTKALKEWWAQIDKWRGRKSLRYQELERDHQAAIRDRPAL